MLSTRDSVEKDTERVGKKKKGMKNTSRQVWKGKKSPGF